MMALVVGGSGSGKSSYAEKMACDACDACVGTAECVQKYYLATMRVFDEEGRRKVEMHRKQRAGKGFLTIEQASEIQNAPEKMGAGGRIVLLECISNLAANEMFAEEKPKAEEEVAQKIIWGVRQLKEQTSHLVIVSNNVFEDGIVYDETTMGYIRAMGRINTKLAALADRVVEVVAGIPVNIK